MGRNICNTHLGLCQMTGSFIAVGSLMLPSKESVFSKIARFPQNPLKILVVGHLIAKFRVVKVGQQ